MRAVYRRHLWMLPTKASTRLELAPKLETNDAVSNCLADDFVAEMQLVRISNNRQTELYKRFLHVSFVVI